MIRRGRVTLAGGILVAMALAVPARAEIIDRVLAIVGGQVITLSDAWAALALKLVEAPAGADPIGAALSFLIDRHLVILEVDRYLPPDPTDEAVARRADELRRALPADPSALARLALENERLKALARDDLRISAYLGQRFGLVQPTDDDVARYYREHPGLFIRDGVLPPFEEVRDEARRRLAAERRQELIAQWIGDLRRRTEVSVLYLPGEPGRRR